eukprot:scaffold29942_cov17-Tisochrysis_lutea.AAC.4
MLLLYDNGARKAARQTRHHRVRHSVRAGTCKFGAVGTGASASQSSPKGSPTGHLNQARTYTNTLPHAQQMAGCALQGGAACCRTADLCRCAVSKKNRTHLLRGRPYGTG